MHEDIEYTGGRHVLIDGFTLALNRIWARWTLHMIVPMGFSYIPTE